MRSKAMALHGCGLAPFVVAAAAAAKKRWTMWTGSHCPPLFQLQNKSKYPFQFHWISLDANDLTHLLWRKVCQVLCFSKQCFFDRFNKVFLPQQFYNFEGPAKRAHKRDPQKGPTKGAHKKGRTKRGPQKGPTKGLHERGTFVGPFCWWDHAFRHVLQGNLAAGVFLFPGKSWSPESLVFSRFYKVF